MILFIISFIAVFVSSYLLASVFEEKKYLTGLIYTLLIAFGQIIVTMEFLSLFSAISKVGILIINAIVLIGSVIFWNKKGRPLYKPEFKAFFIKVFHAMKKDKMLAIMGLGFIFFIVISLVLCWLMPVVEYDALSYHFNRAVIWASQGSLAHFDIADDRNINMAINSEILYTWLLTFIYKNVFIGFFSFAGYVLAMVSLYAFLEINGFCMRKRLWTIFLTTSIAGVLMEASGVEINLMLGALILACLTLFFIGIKKDKLMPVYFSSLAISIAIGTKTSVFFTVPSLFVIFVWLLVKYQKAKFWYYTKMFFIFSIINVLVFSAYNYILNFLDFGNIMGGSSSISYHRMNGGVKGYISGLIRHLLLLLDFSGFSYGFYIQKWVFAAQNKILTLLHIPLDLNVITSTDNMLNYKLNDSLVGGGVVSVLVLIPCTIFAMIKALFNKCDKTKLLALLGGSLYLCIAVMSLCIGFMAFSSRFINTFLILSAPVFVYSYIRSNKNIFKYLILFYVMSYYIVVSTHIWARHVFNMVDEFKKGATISEIRDKHLCTTMLKFEGHMPFCILRSVLYSLPKGSKIGVFLSLADNFSVIKLMEADGYKIDNLLVHKINYYDLGSYDYLIFTRRETESAYMPFLDEVFDSYELKDKQIYHLKKDYPNCMVFNVEAKKTLMFKKDLDKLLPTQIICDVPQEILKKNNFEKFGRILYGNIGDVRKLEDINTEKELDEFSLYKNVKR